MKIALGADHRGDAALKALAPQLRAAGHEIQILGDCSGQPCDYPDQAYMVAKAIADGEAERGILICGSGNGMQIAANKVRGVRAALAWSEETARLAREHNDANVLSVPARMISPDEVKKVIKSFLDAKFEGGRHARRVDEISEMEK